jgi:hypothetical protein
MADKGKEKAHSIEVTPSPSRPATPQLDPTLPVPPISETFLLHVHMQKLSENKLKKRTEFLMAEQINKVPIPLMIDANGKETINFAAFPPGWTII